jgi:chromosome segregation ATPase
MKYLNLLGVIGLAALCVAQGRQDQLLNLRAGGLDRTCAEQAEAIRKKDLTLKGNEADLGELHGRLERAGAAIEESEAKLAKATENVSQLTAERDGLKAAVENWTAAVAERDKALKDAGQRITSTATERNEAIEKFNDLATKYNGMVKELADAREKLAGH